MPKYAVTDYDIQALVDNELKHEEAKHTLHYLEKNPDARKRYNALMGQKNLLKLWWKDSRQ